MPASRLLVAAIVCAQIALGLSGCRDSERRLPGDSAAEPGPAGAEERNEELLEALGYVGWSELETDAAGVTRHIAERSWPGLQLYARQDRHLAELFDMRGRVVHTWRAPQPAGRWHHVEALPDGDLVAIVENHRIDRLDWDSNQRWAVRAKAHHDLDFDEGGRIHVLVRRRHEINFEGEPLTVVDDGILTVSAEGAAQGRLWLYDWLGHLVPRELLVEARDAQWVLDAEVNPSRWKREKREEGVPFERTLRRSRKKLDLFHTNTLEILDRDVPGLGRAGQVLLSMRTLDRIAVVDLRERRVVWSWGPEELAAPHQPSVLANGNVLIFDNGRHRGFSRVIEVDPASGSIVWSFPDPPDGAQRFYSKNMSGCQQLPNGNVLVTAGPNGRVFEVTRDHEIVWEWYNPVIEKGERAALYRVERLPPSYFAAEQRLNGPD